MLAEVASKPKVQAAARVLVAVLQCYGVVVACGAEHCEPARGSTGAEEGYVFCRTVLLDTANCFDSFAMTLPAHDSIYDPNAVCRLVSGPFSLGLCC